MLFTYEKLLNFLHITVTIKNIPFFSYLYDNIHLDNQINYSQINYDKALESDLASRVVRRFFVSGIQGSPLRGQNVNIRIM